MGTVVAHISSENSDNENNHIDDEGSCNKNNYDNIRAQEAEVDADSSITSNSDSSASFIIEDNFLDQHNELCEVCGTGGELLCCSTCTLTFHISCVRPFIRNG